MRTPPLPIAVTVLALLALVVPARYQRWAAWAGDKVELLTAPVSRPAASLAAYLRGPRLSPDDRSILALSEENERLRQDLLRTKQDNEKLLATIAEYQRGLGLNPALRARQLRAPVHGLSASSPPTLRVGAGTRQGISRDTVALAPGLQLVGRVIDAGDNTALVLPITGKGGPVLAAIITPEANAPAGLRCTLSAVGDGTLRGPVEDKRSPGGEVIVPIVGQTVRLDDPAWPETARMLLLGRVEAVDPSPGQPLRKVVTVRPLVANLERLGDVMLWTPDDGGTP
ncbi:MAG: hypothetical protein HBSAPP03_17480 [Phycisphaerae bacterium]|nr:MAG: hypothetical protein HBSAPP03_17480 [Phycisphaerae bacterium]